MSSSFRLRIVLILFVSVSVGVLDGCYHIRVDAAGMPATEYNRKTVHNIAWGLVQVPGEALVPNDCLSGKLDEVRVSTNFGYSLLSVVTLGFWMPMEVEWRCAKECPPSGPPDEI